MLDGARKRAGELSLTNVEFQVLNAEWIDLPRRERRRGAVPLGLHADGRSRRRAARDAPRAAPRRARRAGGVGRDRAQPVGAAARASSCSSAGLIRAAARPAQRRGRSRSAIAERVRDAARARRLRRGLGRAARPDPAPAELRRVLGDDARHRARLPRRGARAPRAGDRRDPRGPRRALRALHRRGRLAGDSDAHAGRVGTA